MPVTASDEALVRSLYARGSLAGDVGWFRGWVEGSTVWRLLTRKLGRADRGLAALA